MEIGCKKEPADWILAAKPAPDYEVDQRINWCLSEVSTQTRWGNPACVAGPKPIDDQLVHYPRAAMAQTAEVRRIWVSKSRAILDREPSNFLSMRTLRQPASCWLGPMVLPIRIIY